MKNIRAAANEARCFLTRFHGIALQRMWPCTSPVLCILLVYAALMLQPGIKVSATKVTFRALMPLLFEGWKTTELSSYEPVARPEDAFSKGDKRKML